MKWGADSRICVNVKTDPDLQESDTDPASSKRIK